MKVLIRTTIVPIKRNSVEFRSIKQIFEDYEQNPRREKSIKLYSLKPYEDLDKKVILNTAGNARLLYDITYETLIDYIRFNSSKRLCKQGKGSYYFKNNGKRAWTEFPFEISQTLLKKYNLFIDQK